jgi:hypothetical protein
VIKQRLSQPVKSLFRGPEHVQEDGSHECAVSGQTRVRC